MKQDLDRYLEEAGLDGALVLGPTAHNPAMTYFTGLAHVSRGALVLPRGAAGTLYAFDMEREEAALTGYRVQRIDWEACLKEAGDDHLEAPAVMLEHILRESRLTGRIQVAGLTEAGDTLSDFSRLERRMPGLTIVGFDRATSPLHRTRATKDEVEVQRIRRMGEITVEVVGRVADFLSSHHSRQGFLTDRHGHPLTIGDVKRRINLWLMQLGAENPEGTIFAVGRDGGIPHNVGAPQTPIPVGQPIVFDIYPCEVGGGYFYDFTRTWCVGHAPPAVVDAHRQVVEAYQAGLRLLRPGVMAREVQGAVCDFFEARGHATLRSSPRTEEGYVHSLGHGLGMEVHEHPNFALLHEPPDVLRVGHVVTVEPGLYYPERGFGVRVEDTVWIGADGPQVLVPYPMDLVLPMRRSRRAPAKSNPRKVAKKTSQGAVRRTRRRA